MMTLGLLGGHKHKQRVVPISETPTVSETETNNETGTKRKAVPIARQETRVADRAAEREAGVMDNTTREAVHALFCKHYDVLLHAARQGGTEAWIPVKHRRERNLLMRFGPQFGVECMELETDDALGVFWDRADMFMELECVGLGSKLLRLTQRALHATTSVVEDRGKAAGTVACPGKDPLAL